MMRHYSLIAKVVLACSAAAFLASCSQVSFFAHTSKRIQNAIEDKGHEIYKIGDPYEVEGVWYYPAVDYGYMETGVASWYGADFHNKKTANGGVYDMNLLTAAHRTLPMPSIVRVTNLENGRGVILKVNDRGPFVNNRIIDVSRRAAQLLGFEDKGTAKVRVQIMADESQAIATRMTGQPVMAAAVEPAIAPMPKPKVNSQPLPEAAGANAAPDINPQLKMETSPPHSAGRFQFQSPASRRIFVQAGAFSRYDNAAKLRTALSRLGNASIFQALVNGRDMFIVRIGPLTQMANADQMLERVVKSGFNDARIVAD